MGRHGTVEKHEAFDVHDLHRARAFKHDVIVTFPWAALQWTWLRQVKTTRWSVDLQFRRSERWQSVPLMWTPCPFGGWRPWFQCICKRRVGKLYNAGGFVSCRTCCNLRYASQRR